jgi:hypothetical protein
MIKKPETDEEFFELFTRLMEGASPEDTEEADEELRAAGMDPDAIGAEMEAHAKAVLKCLTEEDRRRAALEREQFRRELEAARLERDWTEDELKAEIAALVAQAGFQHGAPAVAAHFHKLEGRATKSDLESLLLEFIFLRAAVRRSES